MKLCKLFFNSKTAGFLRSTYNHTFKKQFPKPEALITPKSRILDIGCGNGMMAFQIKSGTKADVIGIDVADHRIVGIPFKKFDGKHIPFRDKRFDASLLLYVLHHIRNQDTILKEAKRVTRKRVIVCEDMVENWISRIFTGMHIQIFSIFYGASKENRFRSRKGWEEYFKKLGFRIAARQYIRYGLLGFIYPVKRMRFVLEVPRSR